MSSKFWTAGCVAILLAAILVTGCSDDPTSPILDGVTFYEFDNFNGEFGFLRDDMADLNFMGGPCGGIGENNWSECISSIEVSDGWKAILYQLDGFNGDSLVVLSIRSDLDSSEGCGAIGDWDNCAKSIRVIRP